MANKPTSIRIEEELKKQAMDIFENLGTDLSSAINIFLKQAVLRGGFPFDVKLPKYRQDLIEAIEEAKLISRDDSVKSYTSFNELLEELDLGDGE